MAINNFHKPIGSGIKHDSNRVVGGTYGERRNASVNYQPIDVNVIRHRDFFERKQEAAELPAANADFKVKNGGRTTPHKIVEAGKAHGGSRITDDARLAFLDKIIAGPAENRAPSAVASPKTTVKSISKPQGQVRVR